MPCDNSTFGTRVAAGTVGLLWNLTGKLSPWDKQCLADDETASLVKAGMPADQAQAQATTDVAVSSQPPKFCDSFQTTFGFSCSQVVLAVLGSILALVIVSAFAEGFGRGVGEKV